MPMIASDGSSLGGVDSEGKRIGEGPGAFAVVIRFEEDHPRATGFIETIASGSRKTTTGEIELMGFLRALEIVRAHKEAMEADPTSSMMVSGDHFTIVLDSEYVAKGFAEHLSEWAANEWRTSAFKRIKHQILWQDVYDIRQQVGHLVTVVHQPGHTRKASDLEVSPEVELNDMADVAAGRASRAIRETGFIPKPEPTVWLGAADAHAEKPADMRRLQSLTERILLTHGRNAAVEAFRLATESTGVRE